MQIPPPEPDPTHRKRQRLVDKLSKCISFIKSPDGGGFKSFGDFMVGFFGEIPSDGLASNDSAYQSVTQTTRAFLKFNPLKTFLDKISSHPAMRTADENLQGVVPPYSISPGLHVPDDSSDDPAHDPASRGILLHWALQLVLEEIDKEADLLIRTNGSPFRCSDKWTWESLSQLSLDSQQTFAKEKAPLLWSVLTTVAVNKDRRASMELKDEGRDPWQGAASVLATLLYLRNKTSALLPRVLGLVLFSCGANRFIYQFLSRLGVTAAYSTINQQLHNLGDSVTTTLKRLGERVKRKEVSVVWIYDNIQRNYVPSTESVAHKSQMRTGTAATVLVMENIPEGAMDPKELTSRLHLRSKLCFEDLEKELDHEHQEHMQGIGIATLLSVWTKYIPNLHHLSPNIQQLFTVTHKKHPIPLRKAQYYPLKTSDIDESSPSGAKDVLGNIASQLGLKEDDFDDLLIPIAGDQLTVNSVRKLRTYTSTDQTTFSRHSWTLPWIQLWHMKWAILRLIFNAHWSDSPGKGLCGLHSDCQTLNRKHISPGKCDFYSHSDFIFDTFEALCLGALRAVLHSEGKTVPPPQEGKSAPNIIQELDALLSAFSFLDLEDLAKKVYLRYMTTKAHYAALGDFKRSTDIYGESGREMVPGADGGEKHGWDGDRVIANLTLRMRDCGWYYELCHAIIDGDIGRVMEVLKLLRFSLWGGGASNYGKELIELAALFIHVFTNKQREAILNNWLVNLSGKPGRWYELDLLQEHLNFWIKVFFNRRNSEFGSHFMRILSLNIPGFSHLHTFLAQILGISTTTGYHHKPSKVEDIILLAARHEQDDIFTFHPGRTQAFHAKDIFSLGMEKLRSTDQIKKSLAQLSDTGVAGPDDEEGTLPGELRGDGGDDNGLPDDLQEF